MKKILLTGGGTAGHVTPNIALIPKLREEGFEVEYVGSYDGIEKKLIEDIGVPYHGISSGKLRRYFDLKNLSDPFRVLKGYREASKLIKELNPDIVFSKGGFVSVPVVLAAKRRKIPAVIHESDITPGLANKICIPCATKICTNFPETLNHLPKDKAVLTGSPIRQELFKGNRIAGLDFCGFTSNKPVIMVIGGSLGSVVLNTHIRAILPKLLESFQVVHLCGKDKMDSSFEKTPGYVQYEYIKQELSDLISCASIVISRAGANAICELLALKKPNILIPLSAASSRGDQILNANSFKKQGFSHVIEEENLTDETLLNAINEVYAHRDKYIANMASSPAKDSITAIVNILKENAR